MKMDIDKRLKADNTNILYNTQKYAKGSTDSCRLVSLVNFYFLQHTTAAKTRLQCVVLFDLTVAVPGLSRCHLVHVEIIAHFIELLIHLITLLVHDRHRSGI